MGIYLGANALGGGGGGAQPGDLVAINQDGTATDDPTTNFIIDYNGGKYLRTGITIPTSSTSANTYAENILPTVTSAASLDAQLVGEAGAVATVSNAVRSSVELQAGASLTKIFTHNFAQSKLYFMAFGGDDTNIYASYIQGSSYPTGMYVVNKSTGAVSDHQFPHGSTIPAALSNSARLTYIMGKGLFANKILCAFGNSSTESGFMVVNKNGTVDSSFNTGLFSSGVYKQTGSGSSNPLYYAVAINSNSKRWTGWMKVNPDEWASSTSAAHISGSTTGNATIPSSNTFELRYVTIYGYVYPGGHYYTAIDHATASMRSGIGLAQNQLAMKWTMEDGSVGPSTATWNDTTFFDDTSYSNITPGSFGDKYDTATAAQAALDALNTANGTDYHSFPKAHMREGGRSPEVYQTFTSNGSVGSRVSSNFPWHKIPFQDIFGDDANPNTTGGYTTRTRGMLLFDSDDNDPSFWAFVRSDDLTLDSDPDQNVDKICLVEYPATIAQRNLSPQDGAQGYVRPMYYDIRDKSITYGTGTSSQRTTGNTTNVHHDNLVSGDTRSKYLFPIWVRLE